MADEPTEPPDPVAFAGLDQLEIRSREYADAGMSASTRRAYEADWNDFASWCASVGASPLPADPATVARYITARAPQLAVSTLARRLAAIRSRHLREDLQPPDNDHLRSCWKGIRHQHGRPARKKRALVMEDLSQVLEAIPGDLRGARDRALILVGFAGALRRGELAQLSLDPASRIRVEFVSRGLEVRLDKSKGDQEGHGAVVAVPHGRTLNCPVAALQAWLKVSKISAGPVFRPIDRWGHLGDRALTGFAVAQVVKKRGLRAGLPADALGGHSLRSGFITEALANGAQHHVVMRQSRHARYDTMRGYIRDAELFTHNAASKVGL